MSDFAKDTNVHTNDCISRQAAIDAIRKVDDYGDGIAFEVLSHAQRDISLLPSAERRGRWIRTGFEWKMV